MSIGLETLYRRSSESVRLRFGSDEEVAARFYEKYVAFVRRAAPPTAGTTLLDIGCGNGWSSHFLAGHGYRTTGVDLNAQAFETPAGGRLSFLGGSALAIPFADDAFDVVATYQTLEHVPSPTTALLEMIRVCKPGGTLCIAGPNLLGLAVSLRTLRSVCRHRPLSRIFVRGPETARHPCGNTLFECLTSFVTNAGLLVSKTLAPEATFTMREPDAVPPFDGDNDACYLCNPIDLQRFLPRHGCQIVQNGAYGRPAFTSLMVSGTWIAARKVGD